MGRAWKVLEMARDTHISKPRLEDKGSLWNIIETSKHVLYIGSVDYYPKSVILHL